MIKVEPTRKVKSTVKTKPIVKVYTDREMKEMHLKHAPLLSPIISGVRRGTSILITPSEASSGIKSYHNREFSKIF